MASGMNAYFLNKIMKLKEDNQEEINLARATESLDRFLAGKHIPEKFMLKEISDDEMKLLIKSISGKKSLGMDWICSYSLKIVAKDLSQELKAIINLSLRSR